MQRVDATTVWPGAALVLAVGAWWLGSVSLQAMGGFPDVPLISRHAAFAIVLGQLSIVSLCAAFDTSARVSAYITNVLAITTPLWPLLAIVWLTSDLSFATLVQSQLLVMLAAALLAFLVGRLLHSGLDRDVCTLARRTIGVVALAVVWACRAPLGTWLLS